MKIAKNNSGMTLVEISIASAMALICIISIISAYLAVLNWSEISKEETFSMTHVASIMEAIRSTPFSSITTDFPNGTVDGPNSNKYATVMGGYILSGEHITVSYVNPVSDPLEITATVSWKNTGGVNCSRYLVTKRTK